MDVYHAPLKKGIHEMMSHIGEGVLAQAKQRLFDCLGYGGCGGGAAEAVSAKEIREEFPEVRKTLWGREFPGRWVFFGTLGDKVTADVTKKYIRFFEAKKGGAEQAGFF